MTQPFSWKNLKKPFFALAPMEEVTDTVFRRIVIDAGRPDVFFTEFTSSDGMCSKGRDRVIHRLMYTEQEKPLIAQLWGLKPENFEATAKIVKDMGFDGIDINMGCPVPKVANRGACSGLIKNAKLANEIIDATMAGAKGLPVSIKTRIGYDEITINEWIGFLLSKKPSALTVHLRTVREMSKVPAHWDIAPLITKLKNEISPNTVLIGNGDVMSVTQGKDLAESSGFDGLMVGRGIFHNPWFFSADPERARSKQEKFELITKHVALHKQVWGKNKNYHALKRFYKIYINGFDGAAELRDKLMLTASHDDFFEAMQEKTDS